MITLFKQKNNKYYGVSVVLLTTDILYIYLFLEPFVQKKTQEKSWVPG